MEGAERPARPTAASSPTSASDGAVYYSEVTITPVRDAQGTTVEYVSVEKDVTEREKLRQEINYLAHFDSLTALANRPTLMARLESALHQGSRHDDTRPERGPALHGPEPLQGDQRRSTATTTATMCWPKSGGACASACATATPWRASAATSLSPCCRTCARQMPPRTDRRGQDHGRDCRADPRARASEFSIGISQSASRSRRATAKDAEALAALRGPRDVREQARRSGPLSAGASH